MASQKRLAVAEISHSKACK